MLGRSLNLTRSALSNFVRHHSHGGIPGEVSETTFSELLELRHKIAIDF